MVDVDLNLLRVFDTLFEQRSVTRAAARLGLTQSAVSHALGRLRQALGDPLFVRGSAGLQPTARASASRGLAPAFWNAQESTANPPDERVAAKTPNPATTVSAEILRLISEPSSTRAISRTVNA